MAYLAKAARHPWSPVWDGSDRPQTRQPPPPDHVGQGWRVRGGPGREGGQGTSALGRFWAPRQPGTHGALCGTGQTDPKLGSHLPLIMCDRAGASGGGLDVRGAWGLQHLVVFGPPGSQDPWSPVWDGPDRPQTRRPPRSRGPKPPVNRSRAIYRSKKKRWRGRQAPLLELPRGVEQARHRGGHFQAGVNGVQHADEHPAALLGRQQLTRRVCERALERAVRGPRRRRGRRPSPVTR